jgi:2-keto-4-pentenoate hydratase
MSIPYNDPRILSGMTSQMTTRRSRLDGGDLRLGWKVGFGAPASLQSMDLAAPLVGFLTANTRLEDGATISLAGWTKPACEPEIAVHIGTDLPGEATREAAMGAVMGLGPAIELADISFPPQDIEAILAGNIYNRHVILGPVDTSRAGCRLDGVVGRIGRGSDAEVVVNDPQALTGDMVGLVQHVATVLAACGEMLRAGDVIITGSIVPPLWVGGGEEVRYALEPIGGLSVRFEG